MAIELETLVIVPKACACCGRDAWTTRLAGVMDYLTQESFDIARCDHCGLQMTQPLPMGEAIGRYYPKRYRGNRHGFTGPIRSLLRRRAVERWFARGFRGRLLDIGCGDGSFALHMKARGWEVCATEIDPETVGRLRTLGVDAKLSATADIEGFDQPFDAITCWHVLEHVDNPRQVVDWVRRQLKPNGVFQATVPNVSCLQAKVFSRTWIHLDVPRHRQHFVPSTLRAMLEAGGFSIQRRANFAWEYDWFGVIQSTLNCICATPNVLFDQLISTPVDSVRPKPVRGTLVSWLLAPLIAIVSYPAIIVTALAGDGATLTLTCKSQQP